MTLKKNDFIDLEIQDITNLGAGIGHIDGIAVFVPNTMVGDKIKAKIIKVTKKYLVGKVETFIQKSSDRVLPCPVAHLCGGCSFSHITYEKELEYKKKFVEMAFHKIGIDMKVSEIHTNSSLSPKFYRNKVSYPISKNRKFGYYSNHSHRIVEYNDCSLHEEILTPILDFLEDFITKNNISIYDDETHAGLLRHILLRSSKTLSEIMICFVINGNNFNGSDNIAQKLWQEFPNIKFCVCININNKKTNAILSDEFIFLTKKEYILDSICGQIFAFTPASFEQVNHDCAEILYNFVVNIAIDLLKGIRMPNIVDLFCGVGVIGLIVASKIKDTKLIGVEIVQSAIKMAELNKRTNNISNAKFFCLNADTATQETIKNIEKSDLIILD